MAKTDIGKTITDLIFPIGAILLGYTLMNRLFPAAKETATSTQVSGACPRGSKYSRGYFETCDPGYISAGNLFNDTCNCLTQAAAATTPATTTTPVNSGPTQPGQSFYDQILNYFAGLAPKPATTPLIMSSPGQLTTNILESTGTGAGTPNPIDASSLGLSYPSIFSTGGIISYPSGSQPGTTPTSTPAATIFEPGSGGSSALEAIKGLGV
jgi:hypothetical protein